MSFLSGLGKVLSIAGPIAAIPFTGGASALGLGAAAGGASKILPSVLGIAGQAGSALSAMGKGRAEGRVAEQQLLSDRDRLALQRAGLEQSAQDRAGQLDLQRKEFSQQAPLANAQQSVRGDILQNLRDVNIQAPQGINKVQVSGGLRPSILSDSTRQLGANLVQQALARQLNPEEFQGGKVVSLPELSPLPQAGKLDAFLNTAGAIGGLAGAFAPKPSLLTGINGTLAQNATEPTLAAKVAQQFSNKPYTTLFHG